ncbi:MAG: hypothetical protein V3U41_04990 [candidate division NC10 bacterium]
MWRGTEAGDNTLGLRDGEHGHGVRRRNWNGLTLGETAVRAVRYGQDRAVALRRRGFSDVVAQMRPERREIQGQDGENTQPNEDGSQGPAPEHPFEPNCEAQPGESTSQQ